MTLATNFIGTQADMRKHVRRLIIYVIYIINDVFDVILIPCEYAGLEVRDGDGLPATTEHYRRERLRRRSDVLTKFRGKSL